MRSPVAKWSDMSTRIAGIRLWRQLAAALLLCLVQPGPASAQEMARLPYETAYSYLEFFDSLSHLELISPSMLITSIDPAVRPEQIEFKLIDGGTWVTFSPDPSGVIDIPKNESWRENTLTLISNQPKGTLQLEVAFNAHAFESTNTTYGDLVSLSDQFNEAFTALAAQRDLTPKDVKGLTFQMPLGSTVTINSAKRPVELKANAAGLVIIKLNPALTRENPEVVFSEIPLGVVPLQ